MNLLPDVPTYAKSRERFLSAGQKSEFEHQALPLSATGPEGEALFIDVMTRGESSKVLLCFSGVHGVEGFTGSAVQVALLAQPAPEDVRQIYVHAVNPWGMAHYRRVNAQNVDLNRNFRDFAQPAPATHHDYLALYKTLHPSGIGGWNPAMILSVFFRMLWRGKARVKQAVTAGQYSHPDGLFFGGHAMQEEASVLSAYLREALAEATAVAALDLHTGLGRYGTDTLLSHYGTNDAREGALKACFGARLTPMAADQGRAYNIEGGLCRYMDTLSPVPVTYVTQEFGSQNAVRVLVALVREHQAHRAGVDVHHEHKRQLLTAFHADEAVAVEQGRVALSSMASLLRTLNG